jgi:signal transduction histidine kinase
VARALYEDSEAEQSALAATNPAATAQDFADDLHRVVMAMALVAPLTILGAAALGYGLAGRALRPMKEASDRARAAAGATPLDLQLPLSGRGDEWDELALTLNGLLAGSRASMERIRHFTADAAHELRTPLTTLVGEAELALRRERSEPELRRTIEIVLSEGRRLAVLVEHLLQLARADAAGPLPRTGETVDLGPLVRRTVERLPPPEAEAPAVQVHEAQPARVHGDAALLEQLVTNLVDNALRHGGRPVQVTIGRQGDRARLEVSDQGPGIAPQLEPVLFERFTRGDAARSGSGHGLGLSIARALAELHGGTLTHARREGPGTTFVVELPAA